MSPPPRIIGIDPGGQTTGIVVRQGSSYVYGVNIKRDRLLVADYVLEVAEELRRLVARHSTVVGVEDTIPPNPHLGLSNPAGIIEAAKVLGAVLVTWPTAHVIRPGGYGAAVGSRAELEARYPSELIGARETKGTGALRHLRSAWDIAGEVAIELRRQPLPLGDPTP